MMINKIISRRAANIPPGLCCGLFPLQSSSGCSVQEDQHRHRQLGGWTKSWCLLHPASARSLHLYGCLKRIWSQRYRSGRDNIAQITEECKMLAEKQRVQRICVISCGSHYLYNKPIFLSTCVAFQSTKMGRKNTIKRIDHIKAT